ncbi:MAG: ATP-binding protein [Campylobacter sp.]|nr:ATP-binding protein [Campylobacter sp.]
MKAADFRIFNPKIYIIIILASFFVIVLGINMYNGAKEQLVMLSNKSKVSASENIVKIFQFWLDERIDSLTKASKFMQSMNVSQNDEEINKFIKLFLQNSSEFDLVQYLRKDGEIFVNGKKLPITDAESKDYRLGLVWYVETKESDDVSVNFIHKHSVLKQGTINLCVPNHKNGEFEGVLCGIVKIKNIFEKIDNFTLPPNSYSFIASQGGEILTKMEDNGLKSQIENELKEHLLKGDDINSMYINSNFISIDEIPSLKWYIGAGTNNEAEIKRLHSAISKNALILLLAFMALALIANSLHNFMYAEIRKRQDEYEIMLAHKAKMSEAGELISGINHQFIQPVNSLNLMISTLLMLKRTGNLNEENLSNFLKNGQKSIKLLSDTIDIFRNFYKTGENITEFSVKQSVKNLLMLMHTELSRANVHAVLNDFEDVRINQMQNIIQQILLILINNAKDALVEKFKDDISKRRIDISVSKKDGICYVRVSEFGTGVSETMSRKIFTELKTTKKQGNGIGLYFGKKLANEKIKGDLRLVNISMPTIFELSFDMNLKG